MSKIASRLGNLIVANSKAGLSAFNIPATNGRVIYNGFDAARLKSRSVKKSDTASATTVVMVATVDDRKDFESFVKAARICAQKSTPGTYRFVVIGDGNLLAATQELARDLSDQGTVIFEGRVNEVVGYLLNAEIGVLMSNASRHCEGLSNSIMEYMACGLPVVCSDGGGNRELVVDQETGFVIPPFDVESLVEKIEWLRANHDRARVMGDAGRRRILEEFSVDKMTDRTIEIYLELLS